MLAYAATAEPKEYKCKEEEAAADAATIETGGARVCINEKAEAEEIGEEEGALGEVALVDAYIITAPTLAAAAAALPDNVEETPGAPTARKRVVEGWKYDPKTATEAPNLAFSAGPKRTCDCEKEELGEEDVYTKTAPRCEPVEEEEEEVEVLPYAQAPTAAKDMLQTGTSNAKGEKDEKDEGVIRLTAEPKKALRGDNIVPPPTPPAR